MAAPRISSEPDGRITIEGDEGNTTMTIGGAQELARRLGEWLGEPDDNGVDDYDESD